MDHGHPVASLRRGAWWSRREGHTAVAVGCASIAVIVLAAFCLPLPYNPNTINFSATLEAPSSSHWFGTDNLGRDMFSRVILAGRTDVPLALGGTVLALVLGVTIGLLVAFRGRWPERAMRGLDMFQAFPVLILAIAIVSLGGNNIAWVVVAIGLIWMPSFIRLVRAEALALRESRFIEAANAIGVSHLRMARCHILPNVVGIILMNAALVASASVLLIAGLSFLGIGIHPPTPSWGQMIQQGAEQLSTGQWWTATFPGLFVVVVVFMFNLIGDGLEAIYGRGARG